MLIDICVAFNEYVAYNHRGCVLKPVSLFDQVCKLITSINGNWDRQKMDYRIYVFYSKPISTEHEAQLKWMCDGLIYDSGDMLHVTADMNRIHAFKYNMLGDYTLYLEADTIVLKTPNLKFDKEVYGAPDNNKLMDLDLDSWRYLYEKYTGSFQQPDHLPMHLNAEGKPFVSNGINAGCILIKNSIKHDFYNCLKEQSELLYQRLNGKMHFYMQINCGIAMKRFDYGYFHKGINYFKTRRAPKIDMDEVEILHYLGQTYNDPEVKSIVDSY